MIISGSKIVHVRRSQPLQNKTSQDYKEQAKFLAMQYGRIPIRCDTHENITIPRLCNRSKQDNVKKLVAIGMRDCFINMCWLNFVFLVRMLLNDVADSLFRVFCGFHVDI